MKKNTLLTASLIAGTLVASAGVSWLTSRLSAPAIASFNMKSTVDAFFDSASRRSLDEAQTKALSERLTPRWRPACATGRYVTVDSSSVPLPWCRGHRTSRVKSRPTWPAG